MEVAKLAAPPKLEVRFVSCNESAIKRWLSSELEETVFSLTNELFMTKHHTVTLSTILTALRNRYRSLTRQHEQKVEDCSDEKKIKARALVELYTYIENCVEDGTFCFKFSVLHQLYEKRVHHLGVEKETNRSRLKEKVLAHFPQAQEQSDGKNKILVF